MEFEVRQLNIAKMMMSEFGCKCIGARVNLDGYLVFAFERNDKTRKAYVESKKILYK